ncbi:MAG: hypothetical protein AB8H80_04575 [Planctomycetota bacterium]
MTQHNAPNVQAPNVKTQRIVVLALAAGQTLFAIVTGVLVQSEDGKGIGEEGIPILATVAIAAMIAAPILAYVLRGVLSKRADGVPAGPARDQADFAAILVPAAMLEGGGLLCTVSWLINGGLLPYVIGSALCICLTLMLMPSGNAGKDSIDLSEGGTR